MKVVSNAVIDSFEHSLQTNINPFMSKNYSALGDIFSLILRNLSRKDMSAVLMFMCPCLSCDIKVKIFPKSIIFRRK